MPSIFILSSADSIPIVANRRHTSPHTCASRFGSFIQCAQFRSNPFNILSRHKSKKQKEKFKRNDSRLSRKSHIRYLRIENWNARLQTILCRRHQKPDCSTVMVFMLLLLRFVSYFVLFFSGFS